jgi:hypothetical protein
MAGGLISRVPEASGIPTVSLSINRQISEKILAPRAAFVKFPRGASFGEPHNRLQQMTILRELLLLLQTATTPDGIHLQRDLMKWNLADMET